jgi:hypothetical protein
MLNRVSPHYVFHSVPNDAYHALRIAKDLKLTDSETREMATEIHQLIMNSRTAGPPNVLQFFDEFVRKKKSKKDSDDLDLG